jgi:acetyl esterase/lipase
VDYRLSWEARFPAPLEDAKCAVRWLRAHADALNIDSEKIAIAGGSAGAHLASLMMTTAGITKYEGLGGFHDYASHVNCAVLFNGQFDMWDLLSKGSLIAPMKQLVGADPDERPDIYEELSTSRRISEVCPPCLLLHGTDDECVSHEQSVAFYKELLQCGVHAELEIYEGKPHAWFNFEPDRTITMQRVEAFLIQELAPPTVTSVRET